MNVATLSLIFLFALVASPFAPVLDKHGVRVSQRIDPHVVEISADGVFDASPERVRGAMLDYEHCTSWVKELAESKVLARGDHFIDVYQRLALPVVADRDYTLHVTWGEEGTSSWLQFATANDRGPAPMKGVVRMSVHEGRWTFEPIRGGTATQAHYEVRMDLAGSLPAWMARRRAAENIPSFFEGLRQRLRQ